MSPAELRELLSQRLADAHALAGELAAERKAADAARAAADGRFPEQAIVTVRGADRRRDRAALDARAAAGQWALISPRLADWSRRAREQQAALRAAAAGN